MELREAFAVLDIEEGSSLDDAKTAYRQLCIVWHPDRFQNAELKAHAQEKLNRSSSHMSLGSRGPPARKPLVTDEFPSPSGIAAVLLDTRSNKKAS